MPPRVLAARRFLARHGATGRRTAAVWKARSSSALAVSQTASANSSWEPLGPFQVNSASYGLVTGRVSSLALDPSDPTGNTFIAGTTGGGVWISQNAGTATISNVAFVPLTDQVNALYGAEDSSISIGAVTMQPGGTGVILAGTGDPNDALDSYYGAGLLRSVDGGNTWTLIVGTSDVSAGLSSLDHGFLGEGFAGFAWSTGLSPQVVVAAVSQAYEGELVDADLAGYSYAGLYYASEIDNFSSWHLARITDGNGQDVQGPTDTSIGTDGNAATAVVWNPVRNLFVAAVRFHGYYQSPDGITWTRMAAQPGPGLTTAMCPTNTSIAGSPACPIFRGALAVNPLTGDTFAWTVDINNQDQGLWQDACSLISGACSSQSILFAKQWSTAALEANTSQGAITIANGDYNLALAAVPSGQDTLVMAGANDLWKCSLAMGCPWRNTTNSTTCMSAQVGEYQHAIAWSAADPTEIFVGNDSGLWRSLDAIGETGAVCSSSDASHWQNLNGALGSLAEVEDMAGVALTPYTLLAGLGANGAAGIKGATGPQTQWPQILGGEGGPVAIDPVTTDNWYANNAAGVSIHLCAQAGNCTTLDFGLQPVVTDADTGNDGLTMTEPAPFLVDPADSSQLLIATCRLWRGPAIGNGWSAVNAITPILGGGSDCGSSPLIRSLAAAPLPGGGEIVYAGLYGSLNGGGNMGGHVLAVTRNAGGVWSAWNDLTLNPVTNDTVTFNAYNLDVSSLTIDPHDSTGQTVYATIAGIPDRSLTIRTLYRSSDGGAQWNAITSNLIYAPANALVVDPIDTNIVYLGTDAGVFVTRQVTACAGVGSNCWAAYGSGLPEAPVTSLTDTQPSGSPNVLVAGTYGRGIWQIPLLTAGQQLTSAAVSPGSITFTSQAEQTTSAARNVTLTNTGGIALVPTFIAASGDFVAADPNHCQGAVINTNQGCTFQVTFSPSALGTRSGALTIDGNIAGGNFTLNLSGTGLPPPQVTLSPSSIDFGPVESGAHSAVLQVTATNSGASAVAISSLTVTSPFALVGNACGSTVPAKTDCEITVQFNPTTAAPSTGALTMVDAAGTQTVQLAGTGTAPPTDTLDASSLAFPPTIIGVPSAGQNVTITNSGGNPLTSIAVSTTGPFQQSNNCTTQLIGGQDCTITVVFIPTAAGKQTGTLVVYDILRTQTVALQGTGVNPPEFTVTPPNLDFSATTPGAISAAQTLTIANSGGASMANIGFQITGSGAAAFSTGATTCGAKLDPGASCTVPVTYTAPPSGILTASLIVTTATHGPDNSAITATVPLNWIASGTLAVQPALVSFPTTGIGQTSGTVAVTLTNQSTVESFDSLTVKASAGFAVSSNPCPASLAGSAKCTVQIAFAPIAEGPQTGTLTFTSSTLPSPILVPLSGTGYDFTAGITGPSNQTVSSGETASYTLTIAPGAGVAGSFSLQCSSLPEFASCSFNPATLAVAANTTGTQIVQIATGQSTAAAERPGGISGAAPIVLACGALLLWPLARRRKRLWVLLILLVVPALAGGLGCSGSGGGGGGTVQHNGNTTAGTYTVPVVVTSSGVQHKVTLTLVVD